MVSAALATLSLGFRILFLGYERIITKELSQGRTSLGAALLFFGLGTLLWLPALPWTGVPETRVILLMVVGSLVYAIAFALYVGALARTDASIVGPLYHTAILFVILLAFLVLDEPVTPLRVAGGVLLAYGASLLRRVGSPLAVLASYAALLRDRGAAMMILGSFLLGTGRIFDKWVLSGSAGTSPTEDVAGAVGYAIVLNLLVSLWLLVFVLVSGRGRATVALLRERPGRAVVAAAINLPTYFFLIIALTGLDVSLAEPASSVSMLVTVLLAAWLLREPLKDRLLGASVMVVGAWLLFL